MEDIKTFVEGCLADARIAMGHGKYKEAKAILLPAYEKAPDNTEVLQKLGGACTLLGEFDEAFTYFSRNVELDPENGNNHYMLGNAYFVKGQYQKAFAEYVEAEDKGCSGEAAQKLHYQMGMICSLKGDRKSALLHLQQYEETDPTGKVALEEAYLTEKLKLYMQEEDTENSVKYARILLEAKPTKFQYYGVLFSLLMASKRYQEAETVLDRAGKYLALSYEQQLELLLQRVAMCMEEADQKPEGAQAYLGKAMDAIDQAQDEIENLTLDNLREMMLLQAEIYLKIDNYQTALEIAEELAKAPDEQDISMQEVPVVHDVETHLEQINNDHTFGINNNQEDEEYKKYSDELKKMAAENSGVMHSMFENPDLVAQRLAEANTAAIHDETEIVRKVIEKMASESDDAYHMIEPQNFMDRLNHILITCYIEEDRFEEALPYAKAMKASENVQYANFGCYVESLAMQKLAQAGKKDKAEAEKIYQSAIAYYKKRMMDAPSEISAAIFRSRLYAENGKYELAAQVAGMLDDTTMKSLQTYIDECRLADAK